MSVPTPSWRPLSPAERAVAIEVLTGGPLSRSAVARRLGMSGASLTRLAKPLIDAGLLVEAPTEAAPPAQGRPGQPLDIVDGPWHFVGLKITGDALYGVVTTLKSRVVRRETRPLTDRDPEAVAELAGSLVDELARDHPRLAGIGVGVGGRVRDRSVVAESQFLGWHEVPFAELLERRTKLPIVVENDVAALVESETWFGAGRGLDRFAVLTLGAGIGYGLVIGGTPVRSADEGYGLGRHWIIDPAGPLTPEGQRGSAVSMLSIPGIEYQVHAATGTRIPYETILELARSGEPLASRVITEAGRALGILLANIANFALPEKVLLAGEGVGLMDAAADTVSESLAAHRHPAARPLDLETKVSDFHDWARGAAVLAIQVLVLGGREGG